MYTIQYAVPMTCETCVKDISKVLESINDIEKYDIDLKNKTVTVTGTVAPSTIVETMQDIGRDAIVRGSGKPNSAAVCILETTSGITKGLVRFIQDRESHLLADCTVANPTQGSLRLAVHESGDISRGVESAGKALWALGEVSQTKNGSANGILASDHSVLELIGRSVVVSSKAWAREDFLVGVVARSAGVWENDKVVCSCSGQTLWEERKAVTAGGKI